MALDMDDQLWLERLFEEAELQPSRLSQWEQSFLDDHRARYEEHGAKMRISPK